MASAALPEEEQHGCTELGDLLPASDKISSELGGPAIKEQSSSGDDFAPKVRKPYTITKQRERWTDEEHKKFIEALKLYGRAWRKIEAHVGSKTAVQIRSHAQKFFSKVVRESNGGDVSSVKPIEIPPPRPKRKPMHPYPRKFVSSVKTGIKVPEKQTSAVSPNTSEQDNQSPTSVLSAMGSDSSVDPDSSMPNGTPSSGSSALALNVGSPCGSEVPKLWPERVMSLWPDHEDENSSHNDEIPLELEPSSPNSVFIKDKPIEAAAQSFKLFGKTLLITNVHGSSSSSETMNKMSKPASNIFCPVPFSWLLLSSNALHSPTPLKAQPQNEEAESKKPVKGREEAPLASNKLSSWTSTNCGRKGFVPYKRCLSERNPGLMKNSEEREQQRIRLC